MRIFTFLLLFLLLTLSFSGCSPKDEENNATRVTTSYLIANARLVPSHPSLSVGIYEENDKRYSDTIEYTSSADKNITFDTNTSKRLITTQDEDNNQSLSTYDDKKVIILSVGNDDDNNHDVPVVLDGPTQDDLSSTKAILKVYNAMVMSDGDKYIVVQQNQNIDRTKAMAYKDQTLGWSEISTGTNVLYEIYKIDKFGNLASGSQNPGQEVFTLHKNRAYMMVIYESESNVDVPYIMLLDVTPN